METENTSGGNQTKNRKWAVYFDEDVYRLLRLQAADKLVTVSQLASTLLGDALRRMPMPNQGTTKSSN